MPGIITHSIAFHESLAHLHRKKHHTFLSRTIEALFNDGERLRAGLFGTLGPNIFDYNPLRRNRFPGSRLSFALHNGGGIKLSTRMLDRVISATDFNTEWAAAQRAYFYGFVSHMVCDYVFHPFVFYWSGFPSTNSRKDQVYFREQNLMFQYNMDVYFEYFFHDQRFRFNIEDLLPVTGKGLSSRLSPPLKEMILGTIEEAFPGESRGLVWRRGKEPDTKFSRSLGFLDACPGLIRAAYRLKRTTNHRVVRLLRALRRRNIIYSDFLVRYPEPRKVNRHLMNLHRERWQNPAGIPGMRYESVEDLLRLCCEITTEVWEKTEGILFGQKKNYASILNKLSINALTGHPTTGYGGLKIKEPFQLRY
jgi:hypothetical protein